MVAGVSPDALLDSYHAERHPAGARALRHTTTQAVLQGVGARSEALRDTVDELLAFDGPRTAVAGLISGLDVAYDLGAGHPLLGRRMPDLDLDTPGGTVRTYALLHAARPVLLELGGPALGRPAGLVRHVTAGYRGGWELPVLGAVPAPTGVLVRPDGHVAWVGEGTVAGLPEALTRWFAG